MKTYVWFYSLEIRMGTVFVVSSIDEKADDFLNPCKLESHSVK